MFLEVFAHEYFWLSFLPISFLGVGFWLLFFDRARKKKAPFSLLLLALGAGFISSIIFGIFGEYIYLTNWFGKIFWEEFFKMLIALCAMEIFKKRFKTVAGGVVYGFAVGLGFAMAENIIYLSRSYELSAFSPEFWLTFQGRFWSSTILHGVTMAIFGLFYASAYLSKMIAKKDHESPLKFFWNPPSLLTFKRILTLHVARKHLLFQSQNPLQKYYASTVVLEGFLAAVLIHVIFNRAIDYSMPELSFFIAFGMMWWLRWRVEKVST